GLAGSVGLAAGAVGLTEAAGLQASSPMPAEPRAAARRNARRVSRPRIGVVSTWFISAPFGERLVAMVAAPGSLSTNRERAGVTGGCKGRGLPVMGCGRVA